MAETANRVIEEAFLDGPFPTLAQPAIPVADLGGFLVQVESAAGGRPGDEVESPQIGRAHV